MLDGNGNIGSYWKEDCQISSWCFQNISYDVWVSDLICLEPIDCSPLWTVHVIEIQDYRYLTVFLLWLSDFYIPYLRYRRIWFEIRYRRIQSIHVKKERKPYCQNDLVGWNCRCAYIVTNINRLFMIFRDGSLKMTSYISYLSSSLILVFLFRH